MTRREDETKTYADSGAAASTATPPPLNRDLTPAPSPRIIILHLKYSSNVMRYTVIYNVTMRGTLPHMCEMEDRAQRMQGM